MADIVIIETYIGRLPETTVKHVRKNRRQNYSPPTHTNNSSTITIQVTSESSALTGNITTDSSPISNPNPSLSESNSTLGSNGSKDGVCKDKKKSVDMTDQLNKFPDSRILDISRSQSMDSSFDKNRDKVNNKSECLPEDNLRRSLDFTSLMVPNRESNSGDFQKPRKSITGSDLQSSEEDLTARMNEYNKSKSVGGVVIGSTDNSRRNVTLRSIRRLSRDLTKEDIIAKQKSIICDYHKVASTEKPPITRLSRDISSEDVIAKQKSIIGDYDYHKMGSTENLEDSMCPDVEFTSNNQLCSDPSCSLRMSKSKHLFRSISLPATSGIWADIGRFSKKVGEKKALFIPLLKCYYIQIIWFNLMKFDFSVHYTQRNLFKILLNQPEIRLCSTFSDWLEPNGHPFVSKSIGKW